MRNLSVLSLILLFFFTQLQSQDLPDINPCATIDGRVPWLVEYQKAPHAYPRSSDILYVPVTVHIVGTSSGSGYFSVQSTLDAFCTLNKDFEGTGIQFFIEGNIRYHNNNNWYEHTFQQGAQMMAQRNVANTINCYIVEDPAGACGYSMYSLGIALKKSCNGPHHHTWAHEIGHYLSLPHPFYGWEGSNHDYNQPAPNSINGNLVERVNGQNCHIAGDGFCDTPADYLNYRWSCNGQGLSNANQTDPTGEVFKSDGTLFMSYALDACSNRFSDDQIAAMQSNLLTERFNLLYNQTPMEPVSMDNFTSIAPVMNDSLPYYDQVTFSWEPIANAQIYILDVTVLQSFQVVQFRYFLEETNFTSFDLKQNRKYFWRVSAYNRWHTCLQTSPTQVFFTGDETLVSENSVSETLQAFTVMPNPVPRGADIRIGLSSQEDMFSEISLLDLSGRVVYGRQHPITVGQQFLNIPVGNLPAGLYFIQIRTDSGVVGKKVVIGDW